MYRRSTMSIVAAIMIGMLTASQGAAEPQQSKAQASLPAHASTEAAKVNLNTATELELLKLPGIGPKKAQAIVALREKRRGFKRIYELLRVKGIGRKSLARLRPLLTLKDAKPKTEAAEQQAKAK